MRQTQSPERLSRLSELVPPFKLSHAFLFGFIWHYREMVNVCNKQKLFSFSQQHTHTHTKHWACNSTTRQLQTVPLVQESREKQRLSEQRISAKWVHSDSVVESPSVKAGWVTKTSIQAGNQVKLFTSALRYLIKIWSDRWQNTWGNLWPTELLWCKQFSNIASKLHLTVM